MDGFYSWQQLDARGRLHEELIGEEDYFTATKARGREGPKLWRKGNLLEHLVLRERGVEFARSCLPVWSVVDL